MGNKFYLFILGMLLFLGSAFGQTTETISYDFRDGTIISNGQSSDGTLVLAGTYNHHGTTYGMDMKAGSQIKIAVDGSCTVRFLGSAYSSLSMSGTTSDGAALDPAQQAAKVVNDLSDTYQFSYIGGSDTLVFTATGEGSDVYLPLIEVISSTLNYDFRDGTIISNGQSSDGTLVLAGTYNHHGTTYGLDMKTGSQIKIAVDGSCTVRFLGSAYSSLSMSGTTSDGTPLDPAEQTTKVTNDLSDTYEFSYRGSADTLLFTATGSGSDVYLPLIQLIPSDPVTGYDFRDGTIIAAGQSDDGSLILAGTYNHHGTTYGMDMKAGSQIKVAVSGSCAVKFLGSAYSSLSMSGTTSDGTPLEPAEQSTTVTNDLSDTYQFVYYGFADTLVFTATGGGSDVYLPLIEVIPLDPPVGYDFRDGSIIANGQSTDGSLKLSGTYNHHSTSYGLDMKLGAQIKIAVSGSCAVKFLGSAYSSLSMSGTTSDGTPLEPAEQATQVTSDLSDMYEFAYNGEADTLIFTATGGGSDIYLPLIQVIPGAVKIKNWEQKSGTITINGTEISLTSGENSSSNAVVTLSSGTVRKVSTEDATIAIDLGGNALSSFTPSSDGEIDMVSISNDTLKITFADSETLPGTFSIIVVDNSITVEAEPGKTYIYNFADGSELPQNTTITYTEFITSDGILTMKNNEAKEFWYHDATHGVVVYNGNSFEVLVAGDAVITFITCTYSAAESVFTFTDEEGNELGTCAADNNGGADGFAVNFAYSGPAGLVKATLSTSGAVYIHGMTIENAAAVEPSNGKIDVWDFGAEQLDTTIYKNNLTEEIINSWYDASIAVGSSGNVLPNFTAGALSWVGGGNDRLRSSNTNLTRYDENLSSVTEYAGRVYVNSAAATGRYMSLTLKEDDEVTLQMIAQNGGGLLHFEYVANPEAQNDEVLVNTNGTTTQEVKFVAKAAGAYHIYDTQDKPSYYRIYRKDAKYIAVTGTIDTSAAPGLPENYAIEFTNEAGKKFVANRDETTYSISLPVGNSYELSLSDANGYIIGTGKALSVNDTTGSHDIVLLKVVLFEVSGSITGLGDQVDNLGLTFTPDPAQGKIFVPEPVVVAGSSTYSVLLEPNCEYTISASGVNDFYIPGTTLTIANADSVIDIVFALKPLSKVTINTSGLSSEQEDELGLTFSNLNEEGYTYNFSSIDSVELRDGTYSVAYSGLDNYPVELGLTSNLTVSGADAAKELVFARVTNWPFNDKVIANGDPSYKGLLFTGQVYNEIAKGHLSAKTDATIQVPVQAEEKVIISYYYSADFSIEGGSQVTSSSGSTSIVESTEYIYSGTETGMVTITVGSGTSTTYFTNIQVVKAVDFAAVITVGVDKDYQTLNEALAAIRSMNRPNNERVTVMIDPGNYEEMLVIDVPNVSFSNAAAEPDIALLNKGVDISDNAVRVTSYYGHGYSYYSMGTNQKWDAEILRVNKENGYLSYENKGAGTTNGSYWNATVVVSATGFEANHVIFENSFNQYISEKEAEDVVVMWEVGGKGIRPADEGNTAVQDRSFVERAAAIAITGSADKAILNKCRVVGRQDSYYGAGPARVVMYKGAMMGAVDYIFGAMVAVFYKTDLVMNTSDASSDAAYLTAAQQNTGRGYLMYECTVTSPEPGVETASQYRAKPGYFGRPWQATTSEVVFYNTTVETSDYPGYENLSLISPVGWSSSLGGESEKMYEFGTIEKSGEDNSASRVAWSTLLSEPKLSDGTDITTFNFTKGNDGWDPLPDLIANDNETAINLIPRSSSAARVYAGWETLHIVNVHSETQVRIYNLNGSLMQIREVNADTVLPSKPGIWIVQMVDAKGTSIAKVFVK